MAVQILTFTKPFEFINSDYHLRYKVGDQVSVETFSETMGTGYRTMFVPIALRLLHQDGAPTNFSWQAFNYQKNNIKAVDAGWTEIFSVRIGMTHVGSTGVVNTAKTEISDDYVSFYVPNPLYDAVKNSGLVRVVGSRLFPELPDSILKTSGVKAMIVRCSTPTSCSIGSTSAFLPYVTYVPFTTSDSGPVILPALQLATHVTSNSSTTTVDLYIHGLWWD